MQGARKPPASPSRKQEPRSHPHFRIPIYEKHSQIRIAIYENIPNYVANVSPFMKTSPVLCPIYEFPKVLKSSAAYSRPLKNHIWPHDPLLHDSLCSTYSQTLFEKNIQN